MRRLAPPGFNAAPKNGHAKPARPNGSNGANGNGHGANGGNGNGSKPKPRNGKAPTAKEPATRVKATLRTALLLSPQPANRGGRPPKYRPQMALDAAKMVLERKTDAEICAVLGITVVTMWRWTHKHRDFSEALARSKEQVCELVEASCATRAIGYNVTATKVFMPAGFDQPVYAQYEEHIPGDPSAMRLYLYNNNPQKYHDRLELAGQLDVIESAEQKRNREIAVRLLLAEVERRAKAGEPALFSEQQAALPAPEKA